ncbi:ABC transporter substrate-binding protein [Virgibacillus sp. C22-A2]|uniref:ABC transporter substrate-binding protein n=1 Tax=Virgibacillus tibetensis TaxID=3042313 RepID=A0ABU6KDW0_9BACI|nr:ABC transporter substrate-binding protein [Virgibacillus sp. C22-A2]
MKKLVSGLLILLLALVVVACSNDGEAETDENGGTDGEKKEITFWHAMSGSNGEAIEDMVNQFNEQSDTVSVEAIYQGSYDDSLTKLRAVGGSSEAPAIVQVFEIGTKYMSESGFITPMQDFIDNDDFDPSILEPNILSYYELDGQLYSMPFNTSNAVMFYNKDMFEEAGLDLENPPSSFSEMKDASEQIASSTDAYGFTMATIGWFFEQLMANQGADYLDNDNGRGGDATEALVNSQEGLNIFNWLNEMNEADTFTNYGSNWEDPRGPFFAGQVAMYLDSTANTAEVIKNSSFEVGTAFLPAADGIEPQGVVVGGASLWITNQVPEEDQEAAWEFIKFTTNADVQAKWAAATGYFPITPAAYDEQTLLDVYEEYPQFTTAVDQLENTTQSSATSGALTEVLPEARKIIETALGEMYEGRDPQEALDDAADKITNALD